MHYAYALFGTVGKRSPNARVEHGRRGSPPRIIPPYHELFNIDSCCSFPEVMRNFVAILDSNE